MDKTEGVRRSGRKTTLSTRLQDYVKPPSSTDESENNESTINSKDAQIPPLDTQVSALSAVMNSYGTLQRIGTGMPPVDENFSWNDQVQCVGDGTQISTGQIQIREGITHAAFSVNDKFNIVANEPGFVAIGQNNGTNGFALRGTTVPNTFSVRNVEATPTQEQQTFANHGENGVITMSGTLVQVSTVLENTEATPTQEQRTYANLRENGVITLPGRLVQTSAGKNADPTLAVATAGQHNGLTPASQTSGHIPAPPLVPITPGQNCGSPVASTGPAPAIAMPSIPVGVNGRQTVSRARTPPLRSPGPSCCLTEQRPQQNTQPILNALRQMREESQQQYRELSRRLSAIENLVQRQLSTTFPEKPNCLPLQTLQDLQHFQTCGPEVFDRAVTYLGNMTRGNINETGNIVLKMALADSLSPSLTWQGREPGTTKLDGTRFVNLLYAAVAANDSYKKPTRREFLDVMTAALKAAKQRNRRLTRPRLPLQLSQEDENTAPR